MKTNKKSLFLMLMAAAVLSSTASAQGNPNVCTNVSAAGAYSFSCSGWTAAGVGGSLLPMMQVGVVSADADGNWSGSSTINIGGQIVIPDAKVTGKTTVNPDCTGNITYNKGTPAELNISYVTNPRAEQIHGLVIDKGTVVSCVLQRIKQ
jgi:hypothetical protein